MLVVSVAAQLIMPKPKRPENSNKAPETPSSDPSASLTCVWGTAKVGGAYLYSTTPKYKSTTGTASAAATGKGQSRKQQDKAWFVDVVAYAVTAVNPTSLLKVYINGEKVFDRLDSNEEVVKKTKKFSGRVKYFQGKNDQQPSPEIEAVEGVGNTPAFRGIGYLQITDLNLTDYGNQYPTITVEVKSNAVYPTLKEFASDLIFKSKVNLTRDAIWNSNELNVDDSLLSIPFKGTAMSLDGKSYEAHLKPYLEFWGVVLRESKTSPGSFILTLPEGVSTAGVLNAVKLDVTYDLSVDGSSAYKFKDIAGIEAPTSYSLTYIDANTNLEYENIIVRRSAEDQDNAIDVKLEYILDRNIATTAAQRNLQNFWQRKSTLDLTLPISYYYENKILQGDVVQTTGDSAVHLRLWSVNSVTIGDSGFCDYTLSTYNPINYFYVSNARNYITPTNNEAETEEQVIQGQLFDTVTLQTETTATRLNPYLAVSRTINTLDSFSVYGSVDNTVYTTASTAETSYIGLGKTTTLLPTPTTTFVPDYTETVTVNFNNALDNPITGTYNQFLQGDVALVINREVIAYQTAVQIAPTTWRFEGLIRGMLDSEKLAESHAINSPAVLAKRPGQPLMLLSEDLSNGLINNPANIYAKVSLAGDSLSAIQETSLAPYEGNISKALAPVILTPRHNGITWTFLWIARSNNRSLFNITSAGTRTSNPDDTLYELKLFNNDTNALILDVDVDSSAATPIYNYDGVLPPTVRISVRQYSGQTDTGLGFQSLLVFKAGV
jgi:hypothetical protein